MYLQLNIQNMQQKIEIKNSYNRICNYANCGVVKALQKEHEFTTPSLQNKKSTASKPGMLPPEYA